MLWDGSNLSATCQTNATFRNDDMSQWNTISLLCEIEEQELKDHSRQGPFQMPT